MLIVDDGSPDGTGAIADRLAGEHDWVRVLHRSEKERHRPRLPRRLPPRARSTGAAYVMEMDTDFSHDPADLAVCSRAIARRRRPRARLALRPRRGGAATGVCCGALISEGGSTYARLVLGLQVRDLTGGFKCFRREVLEAIHFDSVRSQGYAFQVELTYRAVRAGFHVVEVPIVFRDRQRGRARCPGGSPPRRCGWCRGCATAANRRAGYAPACRPRGFDAP